MHYIIRYIIIAMPSLSPSTKSASSSSSSTVSVVTSPGIPLIIASPLVSVTSEIAGGRGEIAVAPTWRHVGGRLVGIGII